MCVVHSWIGSSFFLQWLLRDWSLSWLPDGCCYDCRRYSIHLFTELPVSFSLSFFFFSPLVFYPSYSFVRRNSALFWNLRSRSGLDGYIDYIHTNRSATLVVDGAASVMMMLMLLLLVMVGWLLSWCVSLCVFFFFYINWNVVWWCRCRWCCCWYSSSICSNIQVLNRFTFIHIYIFWIETVLLWKIHTVFCIWYTKMEENPF